MKAASESVGRLMSPTLQLLALADLKLSDSEAQIERRAHFDKGALKELAVSIDSQGMLQPIVVRELELVGGKVNHVVVAGERRYLAAQIAGWAEVPCSVRKGMTDAQVIEVQLVENLQREGLHELAEAEAYEALTELGLTAEQIAAKCGRSPTYVLRRLRLKTLSKAVRRAFYDGKLGFTVALELAKLPVQAHQDELLEEVLDHLDHWQGPMSAADVRDHAEQHFLSELKGAPFPIAEAGLVPKAGACAACPKRSAAQGALFDQVKGLGHCLDLVCFNAKKKAHGERLLSEAKDRGQKVLRNQANVPEAYVRLDHQPSHQGKSVKQLLDKDYQPTLVQLKSGEVVQVAAAADVKKVLPKERASSSGNDDYRAKQRIADRKRAIEAKYRGQLLAYIHSEGQAGSSAKDLVADLELAVTRLGERLDHDSTKRLFKAMGWEPKINKRYGSNYKDYELKTYIAAAAGKEHELRLLLRLFSVACDLDGGGQYSGPPDRKDHLHQLAERLGIKHQVLLASHKDAAAAKKKPTKKAVRK